MGTTIVAQQAAKNPVLALILSFVIPGVGQIYNGQTKKGLIVLALAIVSAILTVILIGIVTYLAVWVYGMYDAYKTAKAMNAGAAKA